MSASRSAPDSDGEPSDPVGSDAWPAGAAVTRILSSPRTLRVAALCLAGAAFALRVYHLAGQSLWYDEGFSIYLAGQGLSEITARTAADIHPPLYYYLLHWWLALAGSSEFAARLPSVILGVLTVPVLLQLTRALLLPPDRGARAGYTAPPADGLLSAGKPTAPAGLAALAGLMAGLLATISPFLVWYGQEARMYTMVTLLGALSSYLLLSALRARMSAEAPRGDGAHETRLWSLFVLVSVAAVYTHFYAFFILAFQGIYGLWYLRSRPGRPAAEVAAASPAVVRRLAPLGLSLAAVALAYLPWLGATFTRFGADTSYWEGDLPLKQVVTDTFVAFSAGRTATSEEATLIVGGYVLLLATGVMAAVWLTRRRQLGPTGKPAHNPALFLLLYFALPPALLYVISFDRPKFDPRYLMLAWPGFCLLIAAGLAATLSGPSGESAHRGKAPRARLIRWATRTAGVAMIAFVLLAAAVPLAHNYRNEVSVRDDFRSVAAWIRERIQPDEAVILCSGHLFPVFEYYYGNRDVFRIPDMATLSTKVTVSYAAASTLNEILVGRPGVWLVLWQDDVVDPNGILPELLGQQGALQPVAQGFWGVALRHYSLPPVAHFSQQPAIPYPALLTIGDGLQFLGFRTEAGQAPVTLFWKALRPLDADLRLTLSLRDDAGHSWGGYEGRPAAYQQPTGRWQPGELIPGRVNLQVSPGTPPGQYRLVAGVYPAGSQQRLEIRDAAGAPVGQTAVVAIVTVPRAVTPVDAAALAASTTTALNARPVADLELIGHDLVTRNAQPGDILSFSAYWRALAAPATDYAVVFRLSGPGGERDADRRLPLASQAYPTSKWQVGEVIRAQYDLALSADTPPGDWRLEALVEAGNGTRSQPVDLSPVHISARPGPPSPSGTGLPIKADFADEVTLLGYDTVRGNTTMTVTLYWEAQRLLDHSYTVFVHLLNARGEIVAQRDRLPLGGAWPTTAWLPGRPLADAYELTANGTVPGDANRLAVGLYLAATGERLRVAGSNDDKVILGPIP
jgi:mannosyltransferase